MRSSTATIDSSGIHNTAQQKLQPRFLWRRCFLLISIFILLDGETTTGWLVRRCVSIVDHLNTSTEPENETKSICVETVRRSTRSVRVARSTGQASLD